MKKLFTLLLIIVLFVSCSDKPLIILDDYWITQTDSFVLSDSYIGRHYINLTYKGLKTKRIYEKRIENVTQYNNDTLNLTFTDYYNVYKNSIVKENGRVLYDSIYIDTVLIKTIFLN